jgi:hypothetical protein
VGVLGERGDGDGGDVVGVDERLGRRTDRQHHLAGEDRLEQVALGEVLHEPAAAHDRDARGDGLNRAFGGLRLGLAAT